MKLGERILDVGVEPYPFLHATVVVDRFIEEMRDRYGPIAHEGKPLVLADIHNLPFHDKCFDFIYCLHVLEHVDDPVKVCSEIMRVGKRGYVETPTIGKDTLFAWAENMHKWHVISIPNILCFLNILRDNLKAHVLQLGEISYLVAGIISFRRRFMGIKTYSTLCFLGLTASASLCFT